MYLRLSHNLNTRDHAFPGAPSLKVIPFEKIEVNGDFCNTFKVELFNHYGTHMDGPNHFNPNGKQLWELPLETFISNHPLLIDIPKSEGERVLPEDLMPYDEQLKQADMLFIRSGFETVRNSDNQRYSERGPGISEVAALLITNRWSNLKAVGMDWISLSSPLHLEDGIASHRAMLGCRGTKPVLIIEDVSLKGIDASKLEMVFCVPLFIEGIDSDPVTVLAKIKDS